MDHRTKELVELLRRIRPATASAAYDALLAAEAKLTDAMDMLDASVGGIPGDATRAADLLTFARDDVRAMRRAANDARLS